MILSLFSNRPTRSINKLQISSFQSSRVPFRFQVTRKRHRLPTSSIDWHWNSRSRDFSIATKHEGETRTIRIRFVAGQVVNHPSVKRWIEGDPRDRVRPCSLEFQIAIPSRPPPWIDKSKKDLNRKAAY